MQLVREFVLHEAHQKALTYITSYVNYGTKYEHLLRTKTKDEIHAFEQERNDVVYDTLVSLLATLSGTAPDPVVKKLIDDTLHFVNTSTDMVDISTVGFTLARRILDARVETLFVDTKRKHPTSTAAELPVTASKKMKPENVSDSDLLLLDVCRKLFWTPHADTIKQMDSAKQTKYRCKLRKLLQSIKHTLKDIIRTFHNKNSQTDSPKEQQFLIDAEKDIETILSQRGTAFDTEVIAHNENICSAITMIRKYQYASHLDMLFNRAGVR